MKNLPEGKEAPPPGRGRRRAPDSSSPKDRGLLVCTGNTCRSVFAEYIAPTLFDDAALFESVGFAPQAAADAQNTIDTIRRNVVIDAADHVPRDVRTCDLELYSLIIAPDTGVAKKLAQEPCPAESCGTSRTPGEMT